MVIILGMCSYSYFCVLWALWALQITVLKLHPLTNVAKHSVNLNLNLKWLANLPTIMVA